MDQETVSVLIVVIFFAIVVLIVFTLVLRWILRLDEIVNLLREIRDQNKPD